LDYLNNEAKSGDMAVLEIRLRNTSVGKWSKLGPATFVTFPQCPILISQNIKVRRVDGREAKKEKTTKSFWYPTPQKTIVVRFYPLGGVGCFSNERGFSVESSLQGIAFNLLLWKRNDSSVVL